MKLHGGGDVETYDDELLDDVYVASVYSNPQGSNDNSGEIDAPVSSIQTAYQKVANNGTIHILSDIAVNNETVSTTSGNLTSDTAKTVTINGAKADSGNYKLTYTGQGNITQGILKIGNSSNITLTNITLDGGSDAPCLWVDGAGTNVTIGQNVTLENPGSSSASNVGKNFMCTSKGATITINAAPTLIGTGCIKSTTNSGDTNGTIKRGDSYSGALINVTATNTDVTIENITLDGGAIWADNVVGTAATEGSKTALYPLVLITAGKVTLGSGAVLQNNDNITAADHHVASGYDGGGVHVSGVASAELIMKSGSEIRNNSAGRFGGGVYMAWQGNDDNTDDDQYGTLTMEGGTIENNYAQSSGGIGVKAATHAKITLSGAAVIKNNRNTNGATNLLLPSGMTIKADGLTSGASIGITASAGAITGVNTTDISGYFFADNADCLITDVVSNTMEHTVTLKEFTTAGQKAAAGSTTAVLLFNVPVLLKDEGYSLTGVRTTDGTQLTTTTNDITVDSNNTVAMVSLSGLTAGTTYDVRPVFTKGNATVAGSELTFTTVAAGGSELVMIDLSDSNGNRLFDVKGENGLMTTYNNNGWAFINSKEGNVGAQNVKAAIAFMVDNDNIGHLYTVVMNTGSETVGGAFGWHADVKIGDNDSAPISNVAGLGFQMTDGTNALVAAVENGTANRTSMTKYNLSGSVFYEDSGPEEISKWWGYYNNRKANYDLDTTITVTGTDSGAAFAYHVTDMNPGEVRVYEVKFAAAAADDDSIKNLMGSAAQAQISTDGGQYTDYKDNNGNTLKAAIESVAVNGNADTIKMVTPPTAIDSVGLANGDSLIDLENSKFTAASGDVTIAVTGAGDVTVLTGTVNVNNGDVVLSGEGTIANAPVPLPYGTAVKKTNDIGTVTVSADGTVTISDGATANIGGVDFTGHAIVVIDEDGTPREIHNEVIGTTAYTITFQGEPTVEYKLYGGERGDDLVATVTADDNGIVIFGRVGGVADGALTNPTLTKGAAYTVTSDKFEPVATRTSAVSAAEIAHAFDSNVAAASGAGDDDQVTGTESEHVTVTVDENGNYKVTLLTDITKTESGTSPTVTIDSNWGDVTLDLNGNSIIGSDADGSSAASAGVDFGDSSDGTDLTITGSGSIIGGSGAANRPSGAAGILAEVNTANSSVTIGSGVTVAGGDAATDSDGYGSIGGNGIYSNSGSFGITVNGGTVKGGSGSNATADNTGGGAGGSGINSNGDVIINSGSVAGGNGGAGKGTGNGGAGGVGTTGKEVTISGGYIKGGNGGTSESGTGGAGGAAAKGSSAVKVSGGLLNGGNGGASESGATGAAGSGVDGTNINVSGGIIRPGSGEGYGTITAGKKNITITDPNPNVEYRVVDANGYVVAKGTASGDSLTLGGLSYNTWYKVEAGVPTVFVASITTERAGGINSGGSATTATDDSAATKINKTNNGEVSVEPENASEGDTVIITVTPDEGYMTNKVTVTDEDGNELEVTDLGGDQYSFIQPEAAPVTIDADFIPDTGLPFRDVKTSDWFLEAVKYAYENGLMSGTDEDEFSPAVATTRGMIVTILYRMEGEPDTDGNTGFGDVDPDKYYARAIAWATENGIAAGYSHDEFAPEDTITREQMATILYRYAEFKGYDVAEGADLTGFTDAERISAYAAQAMAWANGEGLISGTSATTLDPKGEATRAQVAAILMRFRENIMK